MSVAGLPRRRITRLGNRLPAAIAAVGAALLVVQWAGGRMLWLDEEMIAINIRDRSFGALAGRLSLGQAAPYGWLITQRAILLAAGSGERALRFLPVAFGIVLIGSAVWIGRRWMTAWGAAALVFLCSFGQWVSFHALELKHYSADACFGLLLPALGVWATEGTDFRRRAAVWWIVAAASQWVSNGALFVAPATAVVLTVVSLRRFGVRETLRAAVPALIWLASFGVNYVVALGPARSSTFLQEYWLPAFPPSGGGAIATLHWLAAQAAPIAVKPGGSGYVGVFWCAAVAGFFLARPRTSREVFAWTFALVPISAFACAGLHLVPLSERLALWMIPAVYVGIALAVDVVAAQIATGIAPAQMAAARRHRTILRVTIAALASAALAVFFADIFSRGMTYVTVTPHIANHELDDRGAVTWLARRQQPGDVWITTPNGLPAIWWYADSNRSTPMLSASFDAAASTCGAEEIGSWLTSRGFRRALVYFGFGHDLPRGFDDAVLRSLSRIGRITGYRRFGPLGHAVIVEIGQPAARPVTLASLSGEDDGGGAAPIPGCIAVEPAQLW